MFTSIRNVGDKRPISYIGLGYACNSGVTAQRKPPTGQAIHAHAQPSSFSENNCTHPSRRICANMPDDKTDPEARRHYLSGFPSLANFIASDRDRTTLIYKRYDELAARNLLYLQSELAELESEQRKFDEQDFVSDMPTKQCARNFGEFQEAVQANDARQKERWDLVKQIRETLKEYREALLFESTLATLPRPSKGVLKAFRLKFHNGVKGKDGSFPTLGGSSAGLYDNIDDLVALRVQDDQDRLTSFAQEHLAFLFPVSNTITRETKVR